MGSNDTNQEQRGTITAAKSSNWGGKRPGQGRPKGSKNKAPLNPRPQHQLRAFDDEWELILRFAKLVKHGDKERCEAFVAGAEQED